jgi:hypothetical protein
MFSNELLGICTVIVFVTVELYCNSYEVRKPAKNAFECTVRVRLI